MQKAKISYASVVATLISAKARDGDNVDKLFDKDASKMFHRELSDIGFRFLGEKVKTSDIARILGLSRENVSCRIANVHPLDERIDRFLSGNLEPIDVSDIFCWETTESDIAGVRSCGIRDRCAIYQINGKPYRSNEAAV